VRHTIEYGKNKLSLNPVTVITRAILLDVTRVNVSLRPDIRIFFKKIMDTK